MSFFYRFPNFVFGTRNDDLLMGSDRRDYIFAGRGDDVIQASLGSDMIWGGRGFDTVAYEGAIADFSFSTSGRGFFKKTIVEYTDAAGNAVKDKLFGVEALTFKADDYTLFLDGRNNAVLARDDTAMTTENAALSIAAADLLANDSEFDGDTISVVGVSIASDKGAQLKLENGQITYDPGTLFDSLQVGETTTDTFTYTVDDGKGGTAEATVTVTIKGENDAPTMVLAGSVAAFENETPVLLTAVATDVDSDTITYALDDGGDNALFEIDGVSGEVRFKDAPDFEAPLDANGDNIYEIAIIARDEDGGETVQGVVVTVNDVNEIPTDARINEFHYDNTGSDVGEFIEIRVNAGAETAGIRVELNNGSGGALYSTLQIDTATKSSDGTYDYYVFDLPANGLQNGSPDGIALIEGDAVTEFLSYEGSFTATSGTAAGQTSTDVGAAEPGSAPVGSSVQRNDAGDGWLYTAGENTKGAANDAEIPAEPRLNEFHYDNTGGDVGEFIEVRVNTGASVDGLGVQRYNGNGGAPYGDLLVLSDVTPTSDDTYDYYVFALPANGLQNGSPDGFALIEDGAVVEFLSYEGSFVADGGPADGLTSTDVGAEEPGDASIGSAIQRSDDGTTWSYTDGVNTSGAANDVPSVETARINEFHYDNTGSDTGEFVEVRLDTGASPDGLSVVLYNGNGGASYGTFDVGAGAMTSDGTYDYYVLATTGLQNGSPDGLALVRGATVVEFLSYEGSFTATDGPASGQTSTDVVAKEPGSAAVGSSIQRSDDGTTWTFTDGFNTSGAANDVPTTETARINEFHYDNDGSDTGEFVEIRLAADAPTDGLTINLYNGNGGASYNDTAVTGLTKTTDGTFDYYVWPVSGIQNGSPDGIALSRDGEVIEFLSYEGSFEATDGPAAGITSTDVGVSEPGSAAIGSSIQRSDDGESWTFTDGTNTSGAANGAPEPEPERKLVGEVQGSGLASPLIGTEVIVSGVVTYVQGNGFYMQDAGDGDAATSDGIFVFTNSAPGVALGDEVDVTGSVSEFFDLTQISSTEVTVLSSGNALPAATTIEVGPDVEAATAYEAVEGMRVNVTSATDDPLTVITNFNLDRFGEITVSAGTQTQPTQLFDAQTQATEVADLLADNTANRLIIEDGPFGSNPTSFAYIPNTSDGDDGDGILDADDDFSMGGTLRLGTELTAPATGIMSEGFDAYRVLATETLEIDETTNSGAREASPMDPGGELQVVSFNVLNYFTTLSGGTGPTGDVGVRGARSEEDLVRQTDKIVAAMLETGGEIFALQELENNGFGSDSAIQALVDALNAVAGEGIYDFVNPFGAGGDGFVGTDAITTGIIYDSTAVTPVYSDFLVFAEASAADTFAIAEQLNPFASSDDQVADLQRNRPTMVATFEDNDSKETFTVASSHFKSKGDSNLEDLLIDATNAGAPVALLDQLRADPNYDQGDGQGFWNAVRTDASTELLEWLETTYLPAAATAHTGPDAVGDEALLLGDFNAYAQEDPTQAVAEDADYVDLIDTFIGQEDAFSFVFDGQQGTLDQAMGSTSIADNVTGLVEWHINAQEPDLLNYSSSFNDAGFYAPNVFAASDHDPLILGLNLTDTVDVA